MRPRTATKCELNLNKDFLIELLRSRKEFIKLWENLASMERFWTKIKEILVGQVLKEKKATSNECGISSLVYKTQRNRTKPVLIVSNFWRMTLRPILTRLRSSNVAWIRFRTEDDILKLVDRPWFALHWHDRCDWRGCLQHEWTCEHPKHKTLVHSSSKWKYFWEKYHRDKISV